MSVASGISKFTIKKYLEYLEAAFLIKIIYRIDRAGKSFKRANFKKVYLTNPSIRTALFSAVNEDSDDFGALVETAVFAQLFHNNAQIFYARLKIGTDEGEVDIVQLNTVLKPSALTEVKWSDRFIDKPHDLRGIIKFCQTQNINSAIVTTKSKSAEVIYKNIHFKFIPASVYACILGYSILRGKKGVLKIKEHPNP